jgi:hypothetical protein
MAFAKAEVAQVLTSATASMSVWLAPGLTNRRMGREETSRESCQI